MGQHHLPLEMVVLIVQNSKIDTVKVKKNASIVSDIISDVLTWDTSLYSLSTGHNMGIEFLDLSVCNLATNMVNWPYRCGATSSSHDMFRNCCISIILKLPSCPIYCVIDKQPCKIHVSNSHI